ncbi:hypothetical protein GCM10011374_36470 [Kocuria dechangensis]|uniref:Uncharacterized protein n=1 Tax=Kocuria dechangensis TaxID=1176249 RepID=A0A917M065_9MICC|nr:hypothetical protein [Kocuria dechangensis]GGG68766.1 hypothetical protein GCM10011374_36470 [Kocuria dechangensis]
MPMTHYRRMTDPQAAAALEEFLAERPAALVRLRAELVAHGLDPDAVLDGSPASLTTLWRWIASRSTELRGDPAAGTPVVPRQQWPSWARHAVTSAKVPSPTMVVLADGLVSYLAVVLLTGAPNARWALGSPEDPDHYLHHHPVLTGNGHQFFVPALPMGGMLRLKRGEKSLHQTELYEHATTAIKDLNGAPALTGMPADPPVVVVAEPEGFDVGLRHDLVHHHAELVDRMAQDLAEQDGVAAARRASRDALLVDAPSWDAEQLQMWLDSWLRLRLPFHA